jgi:hypothetical protein
MNINGRLLLLVVAIGLFVRVWKTNEHPRTRPVVRSRSEAAELIQSHAITAAEKAPPTTPVSDRRDRDERLPLEEIWTAATCPIPLPAGIAAGTYRVVNDSGRVAKLIVVAEVASPADASPPVAATELMMTVVGGERWYLIGLRSDSTAIRSEDTPHATSNRVSPVVPEVALPADAPTANRKFDFSGYDTIQAPAVEVIDREVIEQASRPRPPEMPSPL